MGTGAVVDIVVGQGSSVIDFVVTRSGYGYRDLEKLTVEIGGTTGIPTDTSVTFNEFQLEVESIKDQSFNGWSVGGLKVYDSITKFFDGKHLLSHFCWKESILAIDKDKGVNIDLDHTLIVFIGNVLQEPGVAYNFKGETSFITFTKAPEPGEDSLILFFEGTPGLDTKFTRVPKTVQRGDTLEIPRYRDEIISIATRIRELFLLFLPLTLSTPHLTLVLESIRLVDCLDLLIGVSPQLTRSLMELSLVKTENSLRHLSSQQQL